MATNAPPNEDVEKPKDQGTESAALECRQLVPDGDIILLIGPKEERIQISSHLLCMASPFFKAMLSSDFKEGKAFRERNDAPAEIKLPEDSAEAMWNAFSTILGADPAMLKLGAKQIEEVTTLADKYQMADRFVFAEVVWIQPALATNVEAAWSLTVAACLLKSNRGVLLLSRILIFNKGSSLLKFASNMPNQNLGLRLCLAIEEFRSRGLTNRGLCLYCFEHVEKAGLGFTEKDPTCKYKWQHIPL